MKPPELIRTIEIKDKTGRVIGTKDVVTYPGLLSKAHEEGLTRIATKLVQVPSEENGRTAIAKALVETGKGRFEGIGDADPSNVNSFIVPHLIRMAETRAKARALRDAVNAGVISFEELDGGAFPPESSDLGSGAFSAPASTSRGNGRGTAHSQQPTGKGGNDARSAPVPTNGNGSAPMSEAQRRYLFRILAVQGLGTETAHRFLLEYFEVGSLSDVTKQQATVAIDDLLKREEVPHGAAEH